MQTEISTKAMEQMYCAPGEAIICTLFNFFLQKELPLVAGSPFEIGELSPLVMFCSEINT